MRLRADSTPRNPRSDQAVSARRPLRRRSDTTARPARVRMRSRNPCTRARRRLFGWKVRLPLATAFSSLCLAHRPAAMLFNCVGPQVGRGCSHCWPARSPDSSSGSQPYRRLSGDCLRVLMRLRLVKPRVPQRDPTERISSPKRGLRRSHNPPPRGCKDGHLNATELLAAGRKAVSFGQCCFA
jgi:hypothetical protein